MVSPCLCVGLPHSNPPPPPKIPTVPLLLSLQFPAEDDPYGYGATLPPELFGDDTADDAGGEDGAGGSVGGWDPPPTPSPTPTPPPYAAGAVLEAAVRSPTSPYALLVAGGSLLLAIILCFAIGMR